ncbi:MAG TPA: membrane protein insertion efficiency factor YidD [Chlamydiales bacterium]|jgi:putative component of membrane protein insertase Oxa1/YidC/SpoIIIJ protein YidD
MGFKLLFLFLLPYALFARPLFQEPWGTDHDLKVPAPQETPAKRSIGVILADLLISFHQQVLSPVDGPRSHYRPSSSQYMREAMHNYGFLQGFFMGCDRLLRENDEPWVYRTLEINGQTFKYDPAKQDKY